VFMQGLSALVLSRLRLKVEALARCHLELDHERPPDLSGSTVATGRPRRAVGDVSGILERGGLGGQDDVGPTGLGEIRVVWKGIALH
jgi:hypothetical protein